MYESACTGDLENAENIKKTKKERAKEKSS